MRERERREKGKKERERKKEIVKEKETSMQCKVLFNLWEKHLNSKDRRQKCICISLRE